MMSHNNNIYWVINMPNKKIAAVYCRVSTEKFDQLNSLNNQKEFFERYIALNNDISLYKIYADEGVTGTSVHKRDQFNLMIKEALEGKFDIILTKEISRFARNTYDSIKYTRILKKSGVTVMFLNDGINTSDPDSELRLAILSSIAQEESRRTSERVKFGQRLMMQKGIVFGHSLLGYSVNNGEIAVNDDEAKTVRLIFELYLNENMSVNTISEYLKKENIKMSANMKKWSPTAVLRILKNEKYCGDLVQLKTVTTDYLSHERMKNYRDKIIIKNHHIPIIERENFDAVQRKLAKNRKNAKIDTSVPTSVRRPLSSE